jgi:tRNA pseudouridine55 synthase
MGGEALRLRNGNPVEARVALAYGEICWAALDDEPVAVGTFKGGMIHPSRVFVFEELP